MAHINISSMSKLKQLIEDLQNPVIVFPMDFDGSTAIEIYDEWRE